MSTPNGRPLEERLRAGPVAVREAAAAVPPAVLLAWTFDTIERSSSELGVADPELIDDLHTGLAVGRGWLASPSWRRSVAAREAGARLSLGERTARALAAGPSAPPGDGEPRLDALARLGALALEACATIGESRAVREAGLGAVREALEAVAGPQLSDPGTREALAARLRDATPRIAPPTREAWARRLAASLDRPAPDGAGLLLFLRLERLVAAWPSLFGPLHHAVSRRLSEGAEGLLAGILPWAPRRLRGVTAPDEAARLVADLRHLVQRFARDELARPMSVQRRPLAGSAVRAVRVVVDDPRDGRLVAPFLAWLEPYAASGAALSHGQTMQFGSFRLRLRVVDGVLVIEAPDLHTDPTSAWTLSLSEVLAVTTLQEQVAAALGVKGDPPPLDWTVLVSRGSEGTPAELRRVVSNRHGDSGWELRPRAPEDEAGIAGRIARTAQVVPLSDVVTACPHILPFITLPSGTSVLWSAHQADLPVVTLRGVTVPDGPTRLERAFKAVSGLRG